MFALILQYFLLIIGTVLLIQKKTHYPLWLVRQSLCCICSKGYPNWVRHKINSFANTFWQWNKYLLYMYTPYYCYLVGCTKKSPWHSWTYWYCTTIEYQGGWGSVYIEIDRSPTFGVQFKLHLRITSLWRVILSTHMCCRSHPSRMKHFSLVHIITDLCVWWWFLLRIACLSTILDWIQDIGSQWMSTSQVICIQ